MMATNITARTTTSDVRPRPQCQWVPVRDHEGRTRMEMRWTVRPQHSHPRLAA